MFLSEIAILCYWFVFCLIFRSA